VTGNLPAASMTTGPWPEQRIVAPRAACLFTASCAGLVPGEDVASRGCRAHLTANRRRRDAAAGAKKDVAAVTGAIHHPQTVENGEHLVDAQDLIHVEGPGMHEGMHESAHELR
jgi:hypothetical protein